MPPVKPCRNWNEASPAQASAVAATVALMVAIGTVVAPAAKVTPAEPMLISTVFVGSAGSGMHPSTPAAKPVQLTNVKTPGFGVRQLSSWHASLKRTVPNGLSSALAAVPGSGVVELVFVMVTPMAIESPTCSPVDGTGDSGIDPLA